MCVNVIIPALNEEQSIGQVLSDIPWEFVSEVIVVDGGSKDETVSLAKAGGARVVMEMRRGYGRACATGVDHAASDHIVFMDADGADDPIHIPALIEPLRSGTADMVLGSRLAGKITPGAMPGHQRFGNWLAARLIRTLYGLPVTDLSPFRAVNRTKLLSLNMQEMTYGWPTEMITKASRQGWEIVEIPVNYLPRIGGRSKISGTMKGTVLATYYILMTIFKYARG